MNILRPILVFTLTLSAIVRAADSSSAEFLKEVRLPKLANAWAKMSGFATHKREEIEKEGEIIASI